MSRHVHICAVGNFGCAIAAYLQLYTPVLDRSESPDMKSLMSMPVPDASINIVAVATPELSECAEVARRFYSGLGILVPVVLRTGALSVGPLKGTQTAGACWTCAERRYKQHLLRGGTAISDAATKSDSPQSVRLSHHILLLVASGLSHLIHEMDQGRAPSGIAWSLDLQTNNLVGTEIEGIHHCPVCGLNRQPSEMSTKQLRAHLSSLYCWPLHS